MNSPKLMNAYRKRPAVPSWRDSTLFWKFGNQIIIKFSNWENSYQIFKIMPRNSRTPYETIKMSFEEKKVFSSSIVSVERNCTDFWNYWKVPETSDSEYIQQT